VTGWVLIALHKPYGVLSQFTPERGSKWTTLAALDLPEKVYPLGRLDADSEGLLLLSDEADLNQRLLRPEYGHRREYWVQVERVPDAIALARLGRGVEIRGHQTAPCEVKRIDVDLPPRVPPIRHRINVPDCWLALVLTEGKNRQVRRMTAAIGHPTLRLYRAAIGALSLAELDLEPGSSRELTAAERDQVFS
jgi:23S rRNA pseudouridine2457 synthase